MKVKRAYFWSRSLSFWDGTRITGIDLTSLTSTAYYIDFNFELKDNAGNIANYNINVTPNKPSPSTNSDFTITGPTLQSSSLINPTPATSPHGQTAANSAFFSRNIWSNASLLNFDSSVWDFNPVVGKGYPTLKDVGAQ